MYSSYLMKPERSSFTFMHSGEQKGAALLPSFVTRMCQVRILEFGSALSKHFCFRKASACRSHLIIYCSRE